MPLQKSVSLEFLDKFTAEIILRMRSELTGEEERLNEEKRARKAVDIEKLRQKFSEYGEPSKQTQFKFSKTEGAPRVIEESDLAEAERAGLIVTNLQPIIKPRTIEMQGKPSQIIPAPAPQIQAQQKPAQSITPQPMAHILPGEIDFGRVSHLIKDPLVTYIECSGENKNIVIKKSGETTTTSINLDKKEIEKIIQSFSDKAKIPMIEGILIAKIGSVEMSAVISDTISPSFVIKKYVMQFSPSESSQLQPPSIPQYSRVHAPTGLMPQINRPFM